LVPTTAGLAIICWTKVPLTLAIGTGSNLVLLIKATSAKLQAASNA